jgi:hypothetical protein
MAGILDSKARIMDFILTDEGRRQIRDGDLRISFASFSDLGAFYEDDGTGVADDANDRIYFEASSRHQDRIVVESNFGIITSFITADASGSYELANEQAGYPPESPAYAGETLFLTGSQVVELSDTILSGVMQNFIENQIIGQDDIFSSTSGFDISDTSVTFTPTQNSPIRTSDYTAEDGSFVPPALDSFDSVIFDQKFAHFPNFKYLPPVNARGSGPRAGQPLGVYPNLNQPEILKYRDLRKKLKDKAVREIRFDPTSLANNVMVQPFEFNGDTGSIKKLSIIDFGVFPNDRGTNAGVHVFFLGKLVPSRDGSYKFFNIFTVELDV